MNHLRSPLCPTHIARDPADSRSNASWWSSFGSLSLESVEKAAPDYFAPFFNPSTFLLMTWYYNGSSIKSYADVDKLIHSVIRASDFGPTFSAVREAERMDKNQPSMSSTQSDNPLPFQMLYADKAERLPAERILERQKWINGLWYVFFTFILSVFRNYLYRVLCI